MKIEYERPRISSGDLRTLVRFFEYQPSLGPEPGEEQKAILHECFARIDEVWSRDLEQAKANNTLSDLTITIRDTHGEFVPSNKHRVEIDLLPYKGHHYNIKDVQPDAQNRDFIKVIAEVAK